MSISEAPLNADQFPGIEPVIDVSAEDKSYLSPRERQEIINLTGNTAELVRRNTPITDAVTDAVLSLTQRERDVLKMRSGLIDGRVRTQRQIAIELKMPKSTVHDTEHRALERLRLPRRRR